MLMRTRIRLSTGACLSVLKHEYKLTFSPD
jgi:hypothetical protein